MPGLPLAIASNSGSPQICKVQAEGYLTNPSPGL